MKVVLGGTFSPLHKGHKALIEKAFSTGDQIIIGLTSNKMCRDKNGEIQRYRERKENLEKYIDSLSPKKPYKITKIEDKIGVSLKKDIDAIIVSPETKKGAEQINKKRREKGLKPLEIITIPMQKAENGKPISSTRIRKGEIDNEGRVIEENKE